ncbi:hypothetical protein [Rhodoligotrophos defluvii]|uniref:hypothetical protein n=1 Tax=Rhodoligotrophos defluvii TaxID=2561934 RepID=UPI0010C9E863|nr:hypothetical protein [Rhodoligotrophos defluvii]
MYLFDDDSRSAVFPVSSGCDDCRSAALPREKRDADAQLAEAGTTLTQFADAGASLAAEVAWNADILL